VSSVQTAFKISRTQPEHGIGIKNIRLREKQKRFQLKLNFYGFKQAKGFLEHSENRCCDLPGCAEQWATENKSAKIQRKTRQSRK